MFQPNLTQAQAVAAARYFVTDFHENLPDYNGLAYTVAVHQFVRELSTKVQADLDMNRVHDLLEILDDMLDLHFRINQYATISGYDTTDQAALLEAQYTTGLIDLIGASNFQHAPELAFKAVA